MLRDELREQIRFLMAGDPVIRWQTMRDLLGAQEADWEAERARVATQGWGAQFLAVRKEDGSWPDGRWTGNVWTMVQLVECGIASDDPLFRVGFEALVSRWMPQSHAVRREVLLQQMDLCHLGFWLRIGAYFCPDDHRLETIANAIFSVQFADGGWNCRLRTRPKTTHSSFHTTFNVLEGLREAARQGIIPKAEFQSSERRALNFMLDHQLYRSDKSGEIVSERFTALSYPSYWHYTVLRALDYIRLTEFATDPRLADPLALLESRRKPNGLWPVEKRIPGETLFDMERMGTDSRWNTLRALRSLMAAGRI